MRLKLLEYSEHLGEPDEWTVEGLTLGNVNLLVGKNASGKSRILNIIHNSARGIAAGRPFANGHFSLVFDDNGKESRFELEIRDSRIEHERFKVDDEVLLDRGTGGVGTIFAVKEDKHIEFQTPENQPAVMTRRDRIQHPFFEPLHQWAGSLYYYAFGTSLGKDSFAVFIEGGFDVDAKNPSQVVAIFHKGQKDFGDRFVNAVCEDFRAVGYSIDEVGLSQPRNLRLQRPVPGELAGIYVKEVDLPGRTDQSSMSQGMFRALSIIVQVNYSVLSDSPSCILIDDIGEGLDYDRSCNLIDVLMKKAEDTSIQLIMATNDRFVMNRVPLEAWSVVDRQGSRVKIRNYANSKEIFDDFKFTGLNNFDFLAFDYLHAGSANE
ncbi:MAG: ATP-binding protein [Planctomycetaceae bacterium]|nr:MAG: ATP-binding protein [Planctomycetaceae bacterium]